MSRVSKTNRMYEIIGVLTIAVMIFILLWKAFQLLVIAPLAGAEHLRDYLPFGIELLLGFVSLILSLGKHHVASFAVACLLASSAISYWWFVICGGSHPIWSDFEWLTVPDFLFAAAVLLRWFSLPPRVTDFHQGSMEAENV
jgi:hypothetical protein